MPRKIVIVPVVIAFGPCFYSFHPPLYLLVLLPEAAGEVMKGKVAILA